MRIGVNTLFMVPGDVGGTETYLRESLLAAIADFPGVDFIIFTNRENDGLFRDLLADTPNVSYNCLNFNAGFRPARIIFEQSWLPLAVRKHKPDLLWSPGYTAPFYAPCPQVVTVCDLQYKSYPEDMSALERWTLDFLVRGGCRKCDGVLAISEFSRREIIDYRFAAPDKVHTVLLGVDTAFGETAAPHERDRLLCDLVPLDNPFILCVAHTYPHKRVDILVEAFSEVMDTIPHNLVIVGRERRGEDQVRAALSRIDDQGRVYRFKDGLAYRTLQVLYQQADIFVLPSVYEGFGLPVIEAMMAGTPVITSMEASLKEVSGRHAFAVDQVSAGPIAEQILRVVGLSSHDREKRVDEARSWAQRFTWQKSVRNMFEVFDAVVHRKPLKG